jgi:PAS domain-containing protein
VESPLESRADEVTRLRDALNELRGIMARPGLWTAGEPPQTVDTLLNVLFGIANEIEERVAQRTRDVARATEALRDSERNSRLVIDSIPGLVAILTAAGELEFVNHQILDYTGRALEELKQCVSFPDRLTVEGRLLRVQERSCGNRSSARPRSWRC